MNPFIGQIQPFGFNFAPRGWAFCNGDLLAISQYTALFSLLGTTYGGDGRTTFKLPELRGRVHMSDGTGPGLPTYRWGQQGGVDNMTMTTANMPTHNHGIAFPVTSDDAEGDSPVNSVFSITDEDLYAGAPTNGAFMRQFATDNQGGGQSFNIDMPSLAVNYCIALQGIYPSRS